MGFAISLIHQLPQRHAQAGRCLEDVLEGQIALATLDFPHKRSVDAAFFGKSLL
jgi:hypothetical protein